MRVGSQATVERAIGEVGHRIRSKKAPFAHLANILHERELIKLLALQIPSLNIPRSTCPFVTKPFSQVKIRKRDLGPETQFTEHLQSISNFLNINVNATDIQRWGKIKLQGTSNLSSKLIELQGELPDRSTRHFEVITLNYHLYTYFQMTQNCLI